MSSSSTVFTPISISASALIDYYAARSGVTSAASTATSTVKAAGSAPTAPWSAGVTTATLTAAATRVLNGGAFINPSAAKLDVATPNTDYKNLFALYQGLSALEGLAQSAQSTTLSAADRLRLQSKFADGLAQVQSFVATSPFKKLTVTQGSAAASVTSTSGVPAEDDSYVTAPLATGAATAPAAALAGGGRFSATVTRNGAQTEVDFDLSDLGANPSVSDVASYMNGKLAAAGALTTVSVATTPGADQTITAGGKTFDLGTGPDQQSLSINGSSLESIAFQPAADATPAVYVAQTADSGSGATLSLSKLDPSAASGPQPLFTQALPAGVTAVRATATGPDGSVYVLADVSGTTADGQVVKGSDDMALLRYDSAGALTYTRTLGAASDATGATLSVSPDGKSVAVAGAVTGALDGSSGADPTTADSVVSVYDAAQGVEQWTTRAGGQGDDRPAALAWGADGTLYMAGQTDEGLPGVAATGGTDAYVQGFSSTGQRTFATVYGGAGTDTAAGLVVTPDGALVTAGEEGGHAVLRRFDPPFSDGQAASAVRDLGALGGGSIAGLGLAADGSVVVAGAASGGLSLGATPAPAGAGRQVFSATLSADLQPASTDSGAWWTPPVGYDATAASAVVQGGDVYITGQTTGAPITGATTASHTGYAVALNTATGAVDWSRSLSSQDGQDAPSAIAVAPTGVSTLDKLGLPSGALTFAGATDLVSNTTVRPGDSFQIGVGSATPATLTVHAGDTLDSLVARITQATGGRAAATVVTTNGVEHLQIAPTSSQTNLRLLAGPAGSDALAALGLTPTLLTTVTSTTKAPTAAPYALGLSGTYSLSDPASAKAAFNALAVAVTAVQKAYTDLSAPPPTPGKTGGTVPAYLTAQIAEYQNALARLTGSS